MKPLFGDWKSVRAKDCLQAGEKIDKETLFHFRNNTTNPQEHIMQMDEVADVAGGKPLYDTIVKADQFEPWIYAGQCYANSTTNMNPALMPMIYVCSRYRAETKEELMVNIEVAKWMCQRIVGIGAIPIAPHLYFPRFMDDNMPKDRYFGMGAGKRLMEHCISFHVVIVDGVISEGMREEIDYMTDTLAMEGTATHLTKENIEEIMETKLER